VTSPGNPRLRAVEAFPVEHEGQRCIALRDPAGFTDQIAVLPGPLLDLVSLFDGEHPLEAIQEIVRRRHGQAPSLEQIRDLAERLDDAGFLDSARFEARRHATENAFLRSPSYTAFCVASLNAVCAGVSGASSSPPSTSIAFACLAGRRDAALGGCAER